MVLKKQGIFIAAGCIVLFAALYFIVATQWNAGSAFFFLVGIFLLLYGVFLKKWDGWLVNKTGRIIKLCFAAVSIFLFVLFLVFGSIVFKQHSNVPKKVDAIIVLGNTLKNDAVSRTLSSRLQKAAELWQEHQTAVFVVTGTRSKQATVSEAQAMREWLIQFGVPSQKILLEPNARDTTENFRYSKEILDEYFKKEYVAVFVTNEFHIPRAQHDAKNEGMNPIWVAACTPLDLSPPFFVREAFAFFAIHVLGMQ